MKEMNELKRKVLELLKEDARRSTALLATLLGAEEEDVKTAIEQLEKDHVIVKYAAVVNWDKVDDEKVTALIEVQITPERGRGFEGIAERIYLYPQVKSVYLMSGAYDLLVEVEYRNLREVLISYLRSCLQSIQYFQPKRILPLKIQTGRDHLRRA